MVLEKQLIIACLKKDRKAQLQLYKKCYGVLMSVCVRYKRNREDAAELVNIGFLKVLNHIDKYNPDASFEAWIRKIMVNTVIDEFRKERKEIAAMEYSDFQESAHYNKHADVNDAEKNFDAEELEKMLHELPTVSHQVFNLFAIDGYGHREIADMLNISEGTSKWHVNFARTKLKEMITSAKNRLKKIYENQTND